jgi:hypothetical protein
MNVVFASFPKWLPQQVNHEDPVHDEPANKLWCFALSRVFFNQNALI